MRRARPAELVPGTVRVITARMDYLPRDADATWQAIEWQRLAQPRRRRWCRVYARGRDYHKVLRPRLQQLADRLAAAVGPFGHRVFTDSAPVLEVELAQRSGIGWRGKHTLALSREAGSMFFLGEIYVDLALPLTEPVGAHCGSCSACIDVCPTRAIVGAVPARCAALHLLPDDRARRADPAGAAAADRQPHLRLRRLPARLPVEQVRAAQRRCPTSTPAPRCERRPRCSSCGGWDEAEFLRRTEGSAIRRIGFERWRRNLAVALGNALRATGDAADIAQALRARCDGGRRPGARAHRLGARRRRR